MGSKGKTLALLLVSLFMVSLVLLPHVTVKAIVVPNGYRTIQQAINFASPHDTILVKKGTYYVDYGGLIIDKPLSLIGEDSQSTFIVNTYSYYPSNAFVIHVQANDVKISGFTIINTHASGISCGQSILSGCNISGNNIVNTAIGIMIGDDINHINQPKTMNIISNNNITGSSYKGMIVSSSNTTISGNRILESGTTGIEVGECSNVKIMGNEISYSGQGDNQSASDVGINQQSWAGISIGANTFSIIGNNITDSVGFGIKLVGASYGLISNNNLTNNTVGISLVNYQIIDKQSPNHIYYNNIDNPVNARVFHEFMFPLINVSKNGTDIVSWDSGQVGNYWSDYNGKGSYVIDQNNVDRHPLSQPVDINSIAPTPTPNSNIAQSWLQPLIIAIVIIAVVITSLLLYRRHRKTANLKQPTNQ